MSGMVNHDALSLASALVTASGLPRGLHFDPASPPPPPQPTPEEIARLKSEAEAAAAAAKKAEEEAKSLKAQLAAMPRLTPEDIKRYEELKKREADEAEQRKKAEEERLRREGEYEKLARTLREETEAKIKAAEETAKTATEKLHAEKINAFFATTVPRYTTADVRDVTMMLGSSVTVDKETGNLIVIDETGHPRMNPSTGKRFTPEEYVASEIDKRPFLKTLKPVNGSGSPAKSSRADGLYGSDDVPTNPQEYFEWRRAGNHKKLAPPAQR